MSSILALYLLASNIVYASTDATEYGFPPHDSFAVIACASDTLQRIRAGEPATWDGADVWLAGTNNTIAARTEAEANALPIAFDAGIAVKDDAGHYVELVPEGQDVVAVQISNSPLDPATRRDMKQAAVNADRQRRHDWRTANLALRSSLTNNIADVEAIRDGLTATSTTAQVRSALIATVRELRQAQGDVQELRRLLANHVREDQ